MQVLGAEDGAQRGLGQQLRAVVRVLHVSNAHLDTSTISRFLCDIVHNT